MSYVRWSTRVREDCKVCDGAVGNIRLCIHCTSCWYIYESVQGLVIHHGKCSGNGGADLEDGESHDWLLVDDDDAEDWEPPGYCEMTDVALDAIKRWREEGC